MTFQYLSVDEVAAFLRTSRNVVYDAVRTGQLPSKRFAGRLIRIPSRVLSEFAENALRERNVLHDYAEGARSVNSRPPIRLSDMPELDVTERAHAR